MPRVIVYNNDGSVLSSYDSADVPAGSGGAGAKGDTGPQGPQGPQGIPGLKGDKGDLGATGAAGVAGARGADGSNGAQGLQGQQGVAGVNGTNGAKGDKGDTGPQGPIGLTGAAGTNGTNGVDGAAGAAGPKGDTGATGAAGGSTLSSQSIAPAPYNYTNALTLSGTPQAMIIPGSTVPASFTPLAPSALMGFYAYSNVAATASLVDMSTGTSVYSMSLAANKNTLTPLYTASQYPLTQGKTYQWMLTGSGSATIMLLPYYLQPASSPALCASMAPLCGYAVNTTFSATAISAPVFGTAAGNNIGIYAPIRTGGIYGVQGTYIPASGTPSTATVTITIAAGNVSTGADQANLNYTLKALTATGLPQTLLGPMISDVSSLSAGSFYYFKVAGNGTGTLQLQLLPVV